jgi:glycogen debranching enzyme
MEAERWLTKPVGERRHLLQHAPFADPQFLEIVRAPDGWGVFASAGPNFRHAVFGRDSIETAADLCAYDKQLAHDVILTLARLQGVTHNPQSEEEPGKIHHEYRARDFAGTKVTQKSLGIMHELQSRWGDADDGCMLYYGSYDATPLYVRLVQRYTTHYGDGILDETYSDRGGTERTVRHSALAAANWTAEKARQREDHLLAYKRLNQQGLENQVWKDSRTSYLFTDGSMPNLDAGIASIELQGYAYDALKYAASIDDESSGEEFSILAGDIRRNTITALWMPEQHFFAQGLGTDQNGQERQIDTLSSNAGLLLDSHLLTDLPEDEMHYYTEAIVATIMGPEFRTPAGIRCRAMRHAGIPGFPDYHGSFAVWPKETFDISEGLEHLGYRQEADELYKNIVQSVQKAGEFYEFFYVETDGTVWYDATVAMLHFAEKSGGNHLPTPEPGQAWTIAAAIASSYKLTKKHRAPAQGPNQPQKQKTPVV